MKIKDKLTIVIPSKNEGITLYECVCYIAAQNDIEGTRVIIADVSDDELSLKYIKNTQQ